MLTKNEVHFFHSPCKDPKVDWCEIVRIIGNIVVLSYSRNMCILMKSEILGGRVVQQEEALARRIQLSFVLKLLMQFLRKD